MSLVIENHRKSFKNVRALESLSFTLDPGRAVALLGPNGAGKTTAIKILVSLLEPDGGNYTWMGEDLFAEPRKIRDLIGYVSQELAMDKLLTGSEFMRFCAGLIHLDWKTHRERALQLLETMGLTEARDRQVGEYSGGMKRRLDLAVALLKQPRVLVLDEPTTGLDIEAREQIRGLIKNIIRKGTALILASHDFHEVGELVDEVLILKAGKVACHGMPEALKKELGRFIVRIKTGEFMHEPARQTVRTAFHSWKHHVDWYPEEETATFAYKGEEAMSAVQARVFETLKSAGLHIESVNIQRPELEDVYRFALGGAE